FQLKNFPYHNLEHTQMVVKTAAELAQIMILTPEEMEIVMIAAWFHDTGYSIKYLGHEDASQQIARNFLTQQQVTPEFIDAVLKCIQATEMPQNPANILEKIICDADLAHLASPDFLKTQDCLRREFEIYFKKVFTDKEWLTNSLSFLNNHRYHTSYTQERWEPEKLKNIQLLKNLLST
ncbi:MAG: metal dependent phosphohydrolase, partial [Adhaeribacter sp.]|nr:metal dependent phosphohydrolase [Adhaeribacter sp.]